MRKQLQIVLGSTNRAKTHAVQAVFTDAIIDTAHVPTGVDHQPLSDEETMQGAMFRARAVKERFNDVYAIGLEGGVSFIEGKLYLCSWGALITPENKLYTASGARIPLPEYFAPQLKEGLELSEIMNEYTKRHDIRHREGAVGIFTHGEVNRSELFQHVLLLLKGQLIYDKKTTSKN